MCVCVSFYFFFLSYGFRLVRTMMTTAMHVDDDATINSLQLFLTSLNFSRRFFFNIYILIFKDKEKKKKHIPEISQLISERDILSL